MGKDARGAENDISELEEDGLAGQMAIMRGGPVKRQAESEDEDDGSGTDGDRKSDNSSDTDSD